MRPLRTCAKAAALGAFLLTRVMPAADPVVVWDHVLNDVLPNGYRPEPAGAVALRDGSLVLSFSQRGCVRVFPGGRVDVLGGCERAPDQWEWGVRMDGAERVFLGDRLTRVDPGTGVAMYSAPGIRLEASTEDSVFSQEREGTGVSIRRVSARDGAVVWKSAVLEGTTQLEASVCAGNELIVAFGSSPERGGRAIVLRAFDLETGRPLWIREVPVPSRPRILLSAGDAGHVILLSTSFEGPDLLIRIDPVSGREVWRRVVPRPVAVGEPATQLLVDALGASSVLWPGYGVAARLAKLDSEGSPVFHVGVEGAPRSIHRSADGHLLLPVAGARGTSVEKRSAASGRLLSRSPFAGPGESFLALSPSLAGGCVLHTFERATSTVVTRHLSDGGDVFVEHRVSIAGLSVLWREEGGGLRWNSRVLAVSSPGISLFDPETGAARTVLPDLDWSSQLTPEGDLVTRVGYPGLAFAKRDGQTGAVKWQSQPESQSGFPVVWLVTAAGEIVSLQREETARLTFRRRSGADGTVTARYEIGIDEDPEAAWDTGSGLIVSTNKSLFLLQTDPGLVRWHRQYFGSYWGARVDSGGDLLVRRNLSLEKIEALTGRLVWIVPLWSGAYYPLPGGDILMVETAFITRLSGSTGEVVFRRSVDTEEPCSFFDGAVAGDGTYWALCHGRGQVVAIDTKTGGVRGRAVISAVPARVNLRIAAGERDAFLFVTDGGSASARLVRVSERMGVSGVPSPPALRCGEEVDLSVPFSGPDGSRLVLTEGALPNGLGLNAFTGQLKGTLHSDGLHAFAFRVVAPDGTASLPTNLALRILPSREPELAFEAPASSVRAGQATRIAISGSRGDAGESVLWFPGGERSREISVKLDVTTRFAAVVTAPGACPRRGTVNVEVEGEEPRPPGGAFFTLAPCRLVDTRGGPGTPLSAEERRTIPIASQCGIPCGPVGPPRNPCGIPEDAHALAVNLTAAGATRFGTLEIADVDDAFGRGTGVPFTAGSTRSVGLTVPVSGEGSISLRADLPAGGTVHAIVDVSGYFR